MTLRLSTIHLYISPATECLNETNQIAEDAYIRPPSRHFCGFSSTPSHFSAWTPFTRDRSGVYYSLYKYSAARLAHASYHSPIPGGAAPCTVSDNTGTTMTVQTRRGLLAQSRPHLHNMSYLAVTVMSRHRNQF